MSWNEKIPQNEIEVKVTDATNRFAKNFGEYLADSEGRNATPLTTSQLRKFFGEVKRQQMNGYNESQFILLKPKLAYAVGRTTGRGQLKIKDFYNVLVDGIDRVTRSQNKVVAFKNFVSVFEAIVAYHKVNSID